MKFFRTAFVWDEIEEPVQVVYENIPFKVNKEDWRTMTSEEIEEKKSFGIRSKTSLQFDQAPLMRVTVIQEGEEEYRIV